MPTPFTWTEEIEDAVCFRIASGMSLKEATNSLRSQYRVPSQSLLYEHMAESEAFAAKMGKARAAQQEHEMELCIDLADEATPEDWQVKKLQIWARQWRAAKLAPRKYGDKVTTEVTGVNGSALIPSITVNLVRPADSDKGGPSGEA